MTAFDPVADVSCWKFPKAHNAPEAGVEAPPRLVPAVARSSSDRLHAERFRHVFADPAQKADGNGVFRLRWPAKRVPCSSQAHSWAFSGMDFPSHLMFALQVNGRRCEVRIDARTTLLDLLREHLGLTGAKKGCNFGECGACTVHLNGRRVNACMVLAASAEGAKVTTIEGLAKEGRLHPVQQAFIDCDAFQCGFCTPGQVMSATALIGEGHGGSEAEIREWMSGNLCRCASYPQIVAAVEAAARGSGD
ncbi:(2Fe-2S)-binding protein [Phenylobacterium sp.]|jgi:xanthine dehydrogenase YagT iron-sulfur-binding subunit|uniref:(2Fe-2S)-binding protein n=1 Tax=Phenylobacterium sp. TaxID=1871053 RepID=UPI002F3E9146